MSTTIPTVKPWTYDCCKKDSYGRPEYTAVVLGARGTGKTHGILDQITHKFSRDYDFISIVCPPTSEDEYKEVLGNDYGNSKIYYGKTKLLQLVRHNNKMAEEGTKNKMVSVLAIYDDLSSERAKKDDDVWKMFQQGRHAGLSVIYLAQAAKDIDSKWYNNAYEIFLYNMDSNNRDYLFQRSLGQQLALSAPFKRDDNKYNKKLFNAIADKCNDGYGALVFNTRERKLYQYRA